MPAKKKAKGFNLAQLDTLQKSVGGVDLIIKNPVTDEPIGEKGSYLAVKVLGPASRQYKDAQTKILRDLYKKRGKDETTVDNLLDHDGDESSNYDKQNMEVITACVTGWDNMYFDPDGENDTDAELEFNAGNLEMVLVHCPWIQRQIQAFIITERNFMRG